MAEDFLAGLEQVDARVGGFACKLPLVVRDARVVSAVFPAAVGKVRILIYTPDLPRPQRADINPEESGTSRDPAQVELTPGKSHPLAAELSSTLGSTRPRVYDYGPRWQFVLYGPEGGERPPAAAPSRARREGKGVKSLGRGWGSYPRDPSRGPTVFEPHILSKTVLAALG